MKLTYNPTSLSVDCKNIFNSLDSIFKGKDDQGKDFDLTLKRELISCKDGTIEFDYAAIPYKEKLLTKQITIASFDVTALKVDKAANLKLVELDFYDVNGKKNPFTINQKGDLGPLPITNDQFEITDGGCAIKTTFTDKDGKPVERMVDSDDLCETGSVCKSGKCIEEVCNDEKDNDNNGKTDCQDAGCYTTKECNLKSCTDDKSCGDGWKCLGGSCYIPAPTKESTLACQKLGFDTSKTIETISVCALTELCELHNQEDLDGDGVVGCQDTDCKDVKLCYQAVCGNNIVDEFEDCDKGDNYETTCTTSYGNDCTYCSNKCQTHTVLTNQKCGDGKINKPHETCDDSNNKTGDGCSDKCVIEPASTCTGEPSTCKVNSVCGDGIVQGKEECDKKTGDKYCDKNCKKTTAACKDEDNTYPTKIEYLANDYAKASLKVKSTVTFNGETQTDVCAGAGVYEGNSVVEFYCSDVDKLSSNGFTCPDGGVCKDGSCTNTLDKTIGAPCLYGEVDEKLNLICVNLKWTEKTDCTDPDNTYVNSGDIALNKHSIESLKTKTMVIAGKENKTDSCSLGNVVEAYCTAQNSLSWQGFACPDGMICNDGACVGFSDATCDDTKDLLKEDDVWYCDASKKWEQCDEPKSSSDKFYVCNGYKWTKKTYSANGLCAYGTDVLGVGGLYCNSVNQWEECKVGVALSQDKKYTCDPTTKIWTENNPVCGDGLKMSSETCDDGNKVSNDGCSSTCVVESGYECKKEGDSCTKIIILPTCTDTDGGKSYEVKGTISYTNSGGTDICVAGKQLIADFKDDGKPLPSGINESKTYLVENYCASDKPLVEYYECPNECKDGACIKPVQNQNFDAQTVATINGTCTSASTTVVAQVLYKGSNYFVDELTSNTEKKYTLEFTPEQKGLYTIYTACQDEAALKSTYCFGTSTDCKVPVKPAPSTSTPSSGGTGGGGSSFGATYGDWSYCNVSLQQIRYRTDKPSQKPQTRDCSPCDESWVCRASDGDFAWTECSSGSQTRVCTDEHFCNTLTTKPAEKRNCDVEGSRFVSNDPDYAPPLYPGEPELQGPSFWNSWKSWVIGTGSSFVMFLLIVLVVVYFMKHTHTVFNHKELVDWIRKERRMGTSDVDIKDILNQNTGWSHDDLEEAFKELQTEQAS
ncbi:DUF4215 domain-containing protein [Candidatus Woesearchaeota archaeon]|nr:DUF4215 domain-containing protein [Candidatus Woesearchaeota archaeon]